MGRLPEGVDYMVLELETWVRLQELQQRETEIERLKTENEKLKASLSRARGKLDLLQSQQCKFQEPERTIVCDILANGKLLPDPHGMRYGPTQVSNERTENNSDASYTESEVSDERTL